MSSKKTFNLANIVDFRGRQKNVQKYVTHRIESQGARAENAGNCLSGSSRRNVRIRPTAREGCY